jgi:hypothetical protein
VHGEKEVGRVGKRGGKKEDNMVRDKAKEVPSHPEL